MKNTEPYKIPKKKYWAIHAWVRRNKIKPDTCTKCKQPDSNIWWANISGEYKRDLNDYEALCCKCHRKKDYTDEWKQKVSLATKGFNNPFFGKEHSSTTKDLLSSKAKLRVFERDEKGHFKKFLFNKYENNTSTSTNTRKR